MAAIPQVFVVLPSAASISRRTPLIRFATTGVALVTALASAEVAAAPAPVDGAPAVRSDRTLDAEGAQLYRRARTDYELRRYRAAQETLDQLRARSPDWRPIQFNTGLVLEARGFNHFAFKRYEVFYAYATPEERMILDRRMSELIKKMRTTGIGLWATGVALVVTGFATMYIPTGCYDDGFGTRCGGMYCLDGGCAGLFVTAIPLITVGAIMHARARKAKARLRNLGPVAFAPRRRGQLRWEGGLRFAF